MDTKFASEAQIVSSEIEFFMVYLKLYMIMINYTII